MGYIHASDDYYSALFARDHDHDCRQLPGNYHTKVYSSSYNTQHFPTQVIAYLVIIMASKGLSKTLVTMTELDMVELEVSYTQDISNQALS